MACGWKANGDMTVQKWWGRGENLCTVLFVLNRQPKTVVGDRRKRVRPSSRGIMYSILIGCMYTYIIYSDFKHSWTSALWSGRFSLRRSVFSFFFFFARFLSYTSTVCNEIDEFPCIPSFSCSGFMDYQCHQQHRRYILNNQISPKFNEWSDFFFNEQDWLTVALSDLSCFQYRRSVSSVHESGLKIILFEKKSSLLIRLVWMASFEAIKSTRICYWPSIRKMNQVIIVMCLYSPLYLHKNL